VSIKKIIAVDNEEEGSGFYRFRGFKGFKGEGGGFAAF
jgi:hypothetical protein